MDMFDENVVLCVSNSYEKKYYFNPDFDKLPDDVKNELKIMCVLFTEEVGGILDMEFDEEGNLLFKSSADEVIYVAGMIDIKCSCQEVPSISMRRENFLNHLRCSSRYSS